MTDPISFSDFAQRWAAREGIAPEPTPQPEPIAPRPDDMALATFDSLMRSFGALAGPRHINMGKIPPDPPAGQSGTQAALAAKGFDTGLDELGAFGSTAPSVGQPKGVKETILSNLLSAPQDVLAGFGGAIESAWLRRFEEPEDPRLFGPEFREEQRAFEEERLDFQRQLERLQPTTGGGIAGRVLGGIATGGLSEPVLTPQEAASPLNTLALGLFPPAAGVLQPLALAAPVIRAGTLGRLARPPVTPPAPLAPITRDITEVFPDIGVSRARALAVPEGAQPPGLGLLDPTQIVPPGRPVAPPVTPQQALPPNRAIPLAAPTAPTATARSIDELIEAGGRIPQEVSFPISIRQTEGANNLDYSKEIIRVRNMVDNQIRQFGDGPVPERLFSKIDEGLNIDVPSTLREASSVLTQASEEAAGLGQRLLKEADELLDQAKADQIQRGIDAIGLTDAPTAARGADVARVRLKEIRAEINELLANAPRGSDLTESQAIRYRRLIQEGESIQFDLQKGRPLNVGRIKPAGERLSILSTDEVVVAHKALFSDKDVYMAISDATAGTWNASPTVLDDIVRGTNQAVSLEQLYDTFAPIRNILRQKYGGTIRLYRATGIQIGKPTTNWASTREGALQYGANIVERDIPIDDILAVNVGRSGNYEEFIVSSVRPTATRAPTAPTAARGAGLIPDEVAELARLKRRLASDKTLLDDALTDAEYTARYPGSEPRPYSVRYQRGLTPGDEGYRPPTKPGYTEAERLQNITEAEDAVKVATKEVADINKAISEERAIAKQAGKKTDPDDIAELNEELTDAKSVLSDARSELKDAKKSTAYTAKEKAYIAAADKFDAEYLATLKTNIQKVNREIADLEARQTAGAPVTPQQAFGQGLPPQKPSAPIKPPRSKPSEIPNGPRTADPSGPPPVTPKVTAGVVVEEPEDILARIQRTRTPDEIQPREYGSRAVEAGRRAIGRGDPERLAAIEAREVQQGQTQTLLRLHGGALRQAENEIGLVTRAGNAALKELGVGKIVRDNLVPVKADVPVLDDLFNALHNPSKVATGEVKVPPGFKDVYDDLRRHTNVEEAMRIDFDPNMATVHDYFYRGWKAPEGVARNEAERGRLGTRPGFKKPRVDASYQEMRDAGFEPLFWNPYEQLAHSQRMGIRYRQQIQLIDDFKRLGIAVPDSAGTGLKGWRTPKVGPAFEGKPYTITLEDGSRQVAYTKRYVVPEAMAARMENMYGVLPKLSFNLLGLEVNLMKITGVAAFIPKMAKLFISVFQQQDFLFRSLGGAFTGAFDALRAGQPVEAVKTLGRWPKSAYTMLQANVGPGARERIRVTLNSTTPILQDRPGVHFQGIVQGGLSTIDPLMGVAELGDAARLAAGDVGKLDLRRVTRKIADWEAAMRRGLFQGMYPAAQITDIRNNIAPMLARKWPNLSDEALNGLIARTANLKYSTIPAEQSVFQKQWLRATLARVFFSPGEGEGLLRQGTQAISGTNAAFWRKHWLGTYASVIAVANIIHFASTREPLPFNRYVPLSRDNWSPLPLGYNRDFASPAIPFAGRSGTELMLDIVGQMDTAFRILDPVSFLSSRESVPVRAGETQIAGEDFFGRPIDNLGPWGIYSRTAQLAQDMLLPIGVGVSVAEFARNAIPGADEVIGESEGRIGTAGLVIQATGSNVRGETTSMLLDRSASESGMNNLTTGEPAQKWAELSPRQKDAVMIANPDLERELELRQETAVLRGSKQAQGFQKLDQAGVDRINAEEALVQDLAQGKVIGGLNGFRATYGKIQSDAAVMRSQIDEDFDLFKKDRELPKDPNQRALVQYYAVFDEATRESTQLDFDVLDEELAELEAKWTPAQSAYVDSETGRSEHPPVIQDYLRDRDSENVKDYRFGAREAAKDAGILDQYQEWKRAIDSQGFLEDHPDLDLIVDLQQNVIKPIMRETDLALDMKLWKWGFVDVPVHPDLIVAVDELAIRQGGRVTNPREIDALLPQAAAVAP